MSFVLLSFLVPSPVSSSEQWIILICQSFTVCSSGKAHVASSLSRSRCFCHLQKKGNRFWELAESLGCLSTPTPTPRRGDVSVQAAALGGGALPASSHGVCWQPSVKRDPDLLLGLIHSWNSLKLLQMTLSSYCPQESQSYCLTSDRQIVPTAWLHR